MWLYPVIYILARYSLFRLVLFSPFLPDVRHNYKRQLQETSIRDKLQTTIKGMRGKQGRTQAMTDRQTCHSISPLLYLYVQPTVTLHVESPPMTNQTRPLHLSHTSTSAAALPYSYTPATSTDSHTYSH